MVNVVTVERVQIKILWPFTGDDGSVRVSVAMVAVCLRISAAALSFTVTVVPVVGVATCSAPSGIE
jgi:hypothetical protein